MTKLHPLPLVSPHLLFMLTPNLLTLDRRLLPQLLDPLRHTLHGLFTHLQNTPGKCILNTSNVLSSSISLFFLLNSPTNSFPSPPPLHFKQTRRHFALRHLLRCHTHLTRHYKMSAAIIHHPVPTIRTILFRGVGF